MTVGPTSRQQRCSRGCNSEIFRYDGAMTVPTICPRCKVRPRANHRHAYCKQCQSEYQKEWIATNPERAKEIRRQANRKGVLRGHGLTQESFDALLNSQDGRCAICGDQFSSMPVIDHDHSCCPPTRPSRSCGLCVRGLLCQPCNMGLTLLDRGLVSEARKYISTKRLASIRNILVRSRP